MRKFYGPPIPGSISPVPATEEMTEPVGIKDGQLWTKGPDGGLEERVDTLETDVGNLQETATEHGTAINNLEIDMTDAENDISGLQNRMNAAESNIGTNAQSIDQLEFDIADIRGDISSIGTELSNKQSKYLATVVTIEPSDWILDQTNGFRATKTVAGVTATNLVQVSPDVSSIDDYSDNNIVCDSQSSDELQFHAKDISAPPAMNINVNVVVWRN